MTIKHQSQNISAEIDLTTLFDIEIEPANALNNNEPITAVKLTRRDFHDELNGVPEFVDLMDIFYTEREIDERIKIHIDVYERYSDLPEEGKSNHIYLVPFTTPTDTEEGIYKEYIWTSQNKYESLGSTKIDLTRMQVIDNLVTSFPVSNSLLSDLRYPSEKLVKESLDRKVDKREGYDLSQNNFSNDLKNKLDNIESGANKTIVDSEINGNSINPVQNKVIVTELNKKVDKVAGKQLSSNDFTNSYKNKLDNISAVGISNDYNDLDNLPTIPYKTSDLTNDLGFVTSAEVTAEIGVVDVIENGNLNPSSSNAVYDHSSEVIQAMTDDMNDTIQYIIDDDEEHVSANLIEIFDVLTQKIREIE